MSENRFVPMTKEGKDCFRRYMSVKEKFITFSRKVTEARQVCQNAETYHLKLINKGVDPESEVFRFNKQDLHMIKGYLEIVDSYMFRISQEIDLLYKNFLGGTSNSFKKFKDRENTIMLLFDVVSDGLTRCMRRRQGYVARCMDALNPFLTNMLDSMLSL